MDVDEMIRHLEEMKEMYEKAHKNVSRKRSWRSSEKAMARMMYFKKIESVAVVIELIRNHDTEAQEIYLSRNQQ